jgi:hypothetical protein
MLQVIPRTPKNLITSSMEIVEVEKVWVTNKYGGFFDALCPVFFDC